MTLYLALAPFRRILPAPTQDQLMPSNTGTDPRVGAIHLQGGVSSVMVVPCPIMVTLRKVTSRCQRTKGCVK